MVRQHQTSGVDLLAAPPQGMSNRFYCACYPRKIRLFSSNCSSPFSLTRLLEEVLYKSLDWMIEEITQLPRNSTDLQLHECITHWIAQFMANCTAHNNTTALGLNQFCSRLTERGRCSDIIISEFPHQLLPPTSRRWNTFWNLQDRYHCKSVKLQFLSLLEVALPPAATLLSGPEMKKTYYRANTTVSSFYS